MRNALSLICLGALASVATLVGLTLLPHDPYVRWQSMRSEAFSRLGWIYERTHFDPTPVDVAFVGTSHTLNSVDAQAVAEGLGLSGLRNAQGRCPTAANFAIPAYGRNMHWLIAREVLENRTPDVLVLEVFENETRKAHDAFIYAATSKDILTAPMLININGPEDIARLPFRQLTLAIKSLAPQAYGLKDRFDLATYDGSTVDNTRQVKVGGVAFSPPRDKAEDRKSLEETADRNAATKDLNMLPERFESYEYAVPRRYVDQILDLAEKKGVKVVFLYLPGYRKPAAPYDASLYQGRGEMIFPATDLLTQPELWLDADHLTSEGARLVSERLPALIAPTLAQKGWGVREANGEACSNGYPERPVERPFRTRPANG